MRNEQGQVIGASKIARDISDRKRVERLMIQSEKLAATGRMAAAVAHEINNPLESIINLVYLARQNTEESARAYQFLVTAEEELERVSHIARQTLGFYRETGVAAEVYISELLETVLTVYRARLLSTGVSVDTQFNDLQRVVVSKGELLQVLSNIVANAIDAMPKGGLSASPFAKLCVPAAMEFRSAFVMMVWGSRRKTWKKFSSPFSRRRVTWNRNWTLGCETAGGKTRRSDISIASSTEAGCSGSTVTIFIPLAVPPSHAAIKPNEGELKQRTYS